MINLVGCKLDEEFEPGFTSVSSRGSDEAHISQWQHGREMKFTQSLSE